MPLLHQFLQNKLIQQLFFKNSCIRFLANLMDCMVTNTRAQIEEHMLSQHYFLYGEEHQKSDLHTGIKVTFSV